MCVLTQLVVVVLVENIRKILNNFTFYTSYIVSRQPTMSSSSSATSTSVVDQVLRLALFDHLPRKQYPRNPDSIEGDRVMINPT